MRPPWNSPLATSVKGIGLPPKVTVSVLAILQGRCNLRMGGLSLPRQAPLSKTSYARVRGPQKKGGASSEAPTVYRRSALPAAYHL